MSVIDRVRILVLGDSGVGKTSFVHLAAHNEPLRSPSWTVGCSVDVKLHEYKEGMKDQKTFFVEFWDIGGSHSHRNARPVFYNPFHGAILVHDLTNRKSEKNLHKWVREISVNRRERKDSNSATNPVLPGLLGDDFDQESFIGNMSIPYIVIGTKLDQLDDRKTRIEHMASHLGCDEILMDCRQTRYLAAGTSNAVKLSRFYDKAIEMRSKSHKDSFTERFGDPISPILSTKFYSPHQD
ncbi:rab-like protein 3 [Diabrotica virgifera virgifera]|uniref:Rab-like protein 3 n=1 Tax=Diabrotica virgifera virgifera TaxID=50390 RepID=A0A6P7GS40_DIAVI|nr:rab-like protein 3 [Diabrotica virgifera virgifera]